MGRDEDGRYWWHSVRLPDGRVTPGEKTRDVLNSEWENLHLPPLKGRAVLDIGAWDGWFSFAAERAGASRVVALDHHVWSLEPADRYLDHANQVVAAGGWDAPWGPECSWWDPDGLPGKESFEFARQALGSAVEPAAIDFMTCDLSTLGTFDVTLFLGVLYHLREPLTALQRLHAVTGDLAVVETAAISIEGHDDRPLLEFTPGEEVNRDTSNWFFPNEAGAVSLLRAAGFDEVVPVARSFHQNLRPGVTDFRLTLHARPNRGIPRQSNVNDLDDRAHVSTLADLQATVPKLRARYAKSERALVATGRRVHDLEGSLADRERVIADREHAIADREHVIADRERVIADREHAIAELKSSTSWRVTAPLRALKDLISR